MNTKNIERMEIERIYGIISPFELRNSLIQLARDEGKKSAHTLLDAGRGNPNWTAAPPREAFFTFGQFAVHAARKTWKTCDCQNLLAGMPKKTGIAEEFKKYAEKHSYMPGMNLLNEIINYGTEQKGFDPDNWIYELADGIIGDNYPSPVRILPHIADVVQDYLKEEIYSEDPSPEFDMFAVEGATAGMCYIFDSLIANNLLEIDDTIAIMTPIFTPYLEIPLIPRYGFKIINIQASEFSRNGQKSWHYSDEEIEKLANNDIKALFLVNPSNPPSVAIRPESMEKLTAIVKKYNPNLMVISDDVYGTFVDDFKSAASYLPFNTIGVYSFSKYFGVTGWRLGTISLARQNVFDHLLEALPEHERKSARRRYEALSTNPENIKFIDRIAADSRQVALNHTAGLSTPQQVQMAFFAVFSLIDRNHSYKQIIQDICRRRKRKLFESLGLDLTEDPYSASYYTEFDILELSQNFYGEEFTGYLKSNYKPVDILFSLAEKSSIVLLSGAGFKGPEWSIRISLANLEDEDYKKIGEVLHNVLEDYACKWEKSNKKPAGIS
ncbi:MAG: aspartate 4-decarboxylase [Clostridium sp.]|jgi:aspartate 4-decarboxylase|uniref:aspartate 4-decarboxylase n=1 Tax=Clostridium sp. TaxID=1506 RepID=UPI0025C554F9|nr:aspartate 4-decarboxylase [Clostridium sp.]MCH3965965.1 aspartate 4-decarboxylase [Clostridium sp.]MCI1715947.1 aspartate 4-decarboxylase [Clostridium sp.]MCI1800381.1 aspartate 4-decarboxylase [Clostridium sp.]MCI1814124.1 aspartate 4-decarboxylase [Clostridium sp.]MCI1871022.1 aspartate 4-decarboxylase [Clostridium sp.]